VNPPNPYHYTAQDFADEFQVGRHFIYTKARALGIGIRAGRGGRYRFNDEDRRKLIASMKPEPPVARKRKRAA
jgi:hypothetical protein